jgi:hypothetical protein
MELSKQNYLQHIELQRKIKIKVLMATLEKNVIYVEKMEN